VIHRVQYGKPPITFRQATLPAQVGMWIQYFSWQWGHDWSREVQRGLAVIFAFLAAVGAVRHWRADKRSAAAMTTLMFTLTVALIFYLNFKYGFSQYPDRQLAREVRERDYFYIASFAAWGIWVAMGIATLMEWLQEGLAERVPDVARRWAAATPVAALALIPCGVTTSRRHGRVKRWRATSPGTSCSRWNPTASSSRRATTTPSRCGTRRKWRACARTSRCSTSRSPTRRGT